MPTLHICETLYEKMFEETFLKQIKMQQIPIINLRLEVRNYMGLFNNPKFCEQFYRKRKKNEPINTLYESWYGRNELLLSQILRQSILAIESATCSCVYFQAAFLKKLDDKVIKAVNNPFSLGGKGTAVNIFDRLPATIDPDYKLSYRNPDLWKDINFFYKNIRNPLFHGKEIAEPNPSTVKYYLEFILKIFNWLDSWFDLDKLINNASSLIEIPEFDRFINQIVISDYVPEFKPMKRDDLLEIPPIKDVKGIWIQDYVHLTTTTVDDIAMNLKISQQAAMKLLGYLALAQRDKGWPIPERL